MTLDDFKHQSNEEQADNLRKHGVFLAERLCVHSRVYLYVLSSIYIELFQELDELENSPIRILRVFEDPSELGEYLRGIDISPLVTTS